MYLKVRPSAIFLRPFNQFKESIGGGGESIPQLISAKTVVIPQRARGSYRKIFSTVKAFHLEQPIEFLHEQRRIEVN